jgi:hypothetical protein
MSEASPDARTFAVSDEQHALPAVPMSSARQDISAHSPFGAVLWRTLTEHVGQVDLMSRQEYGVLASAWSRRSSSLAPRAQDWSALHERDYALHSRRAR